MAYSQCTKCGGFIWITDPQTTNYRVCDCHDYVNEEPQPTDLEILERAREQGYVFLCKHWISVRRPNDRNPMNSMECAKWQELCDKLRSELQC